MSKKSPIQFSIGVLIGTLTWTAIAFSLGISFGANGMVLAFIIAFSFFFALRNCLQFRKVIGIPLIKVNLVHLLVGIALSMMVKALDTGPMCGTAAIDFVAAFCAILYVFSIYFLDYVDRPK
jgi:hypothetical protein